MTILFSESEFTWIMRAETGDTLVTRYWDGQDESELETMDLDLEGDSLRFNSRGVSDISTSRTSLATARFLAGNSEYEVNFNGMGAYRIDAK